MHTLQWIVIEADDEETAASTAERLLEEAMGDSENPASWYDWFVVGGGRWNQMQDPYHNSTNMIISYDKDPNGFRAKIDKAIEYRVEEYNRLLDEVKQGDILAKLDNYGGAMSYDMAFYSLKNLIRFQSGDWFYDSAFFDFTAWSTNATHILSKLDNHDLVTPKVTSGMFLVPIDFHF
jgi:hypothetical protein